MAGALSRVFEIKPALLAGRQRFEIAEGQVICRDVEDRVAWQVALGDITRAVYVEHRMYGMRLCRFDLLVGEVQHSISLNLSVLTEGKDPDGPEFLDLIEAICTALEAAQPGFETEWGEYGRARKWWFGVGVLSGFGGLGLFVLALATGVPMDRMMGAGLGFGMLILLGGVLMVTYNPWKAPPRLQPALLVRVLRLKLEKKGG